MIWGRKEHPTRSVKYQGRAIKELENTLLYELGEISKTVQCPTCFRYSQEGTFYCTCGVCFMPSPEQTRKIKTRFEIASVPFSTVREDDSRRAKHGRERLQYDHWKAKDATRRRIQEKLPFLFCTDDRQTNDIKNLNGITDGQTYCEYLDNFATVDATYIATWPERSRYHNILVLKLHDGKTSGKMPYRDDFKLAARSCSRTPGWKGKPYIPRSQRERQKTIR